MAKIPPDIIDEIRNKTDIVALINQQVPLKRAGENYKGACPFHKEKTPSFIVSPRKQIFHCFGCHVGGNAFSFLMQYDNINFVEAVKKLSHEAGIDVERYLQSDSRESSERGKLYDINTKAAEHFHQELMNNKDAYNYFAQRKIDDALIKEFKLGFAPDLWDSFYKILGKEEIPYAIKLGLLISGKRDYDRFRHRLIFPIYSTSKQILGFGGRRLKDDQDPKYLNSPESEIYNKRDILFGLSHAVDAIRREATCIFVEGYMDVLRCHQYEIKNVVATSGTALTDSHARLIARYCKKVFLMFDSDQAGLDAAIRSISILLKQNIDIHVVPMPRGADPDTILLKYGRDKFFDYIAKSKNFIDFQYSLAEKRGQLANSNERADLIKRVSEQLNHVSDSVLKQVLQQQTESRFNVKLDDVKSSSSPEEESLKSSTEVIQAYQSINKPEYHEEKQIMGSVLNLEQEYSLKILDKLDTEFFRNNFFKRFATHLVEQYKREGKIELSHLLKKDKNNIINSFVSEMSLLDYGNPDQQVEDVLIVLKRAKIQREIDQLRQNQNEENLKRIEQLLQQRNKLQTV